MRALYIRSLLTVVLASGRCFPDELSEARQHLNAALVRADLYNWEEAAPDFAAAETLFRAGGDRAGEFHARLGRIRSTVEQERRNLPAVSIELDDELRTNPLLQSDKQLRMFALIVKGDIDSETLTSTMREDWEQVLALAVELKDGKWQNRASAQLGLTAFYDGDADKAASAVAQAIQIANKTGDAGAQIRFLSAVGLGLTKARLYPQALEYFTMALGVAASHPESGYPYLTNEGRAAALIGSERWDLAGNVCDELLGKAKEAGRSVHVANALSLRALLLRAKGDQAGALAVIQQAIAIAEAAGMYRSLGEMQALLASSVAAAGDLKTAREVAARAADSTQKSGDAWAVPERLLRVADLMARTGDTAGALDTFERGEAYVDLLTGRALTIQQRSALLSAASELYARHFDFVATTLKRPDLAFAVIEQVRGRLNTDVLLEGTARHPLAAESERKVSRLRLQLMAARKTSEVMKLRREIFMAEQVRWTNPGVTINHVDPLDRVDLRTLQREIATGEAVLEFVVGEPRSHCLVITQSSARLVELAGRRQIERLANSYLASVKARRAGIADAKALYAAVLRPVQLPASITAITVVRDGPLFLFPLDGLVGTDGRYVVERVTVQHAPSASSIYLDRQASRSRGQTGRSFLAVGGVPYANAGLTKGAITRGSASGALSNLPASEEELRVSGQALAAKLKLLLTGRQATETAFKKADLAKFQFIHLAVHGIADMSFPERAALVMLSDPATGEDGFLQAAEIVLLQLTGQTVVLSACDTAVGALQGQEGIANIARAFLIAGAREVVSSVWAVDDTASLFLMRSMYQHIATGMRAPAALTAAKRDMIQKFGTHAAPYLWAGFTADSTSRPLSRSTSGTRARVAVQP